MSYLRKGIIMEKKTSFVDIEELNEYVEEVKQNQILLTKEELIELYNYIRNSILVDPKDKLRLLDEVTQIMSM